MKLILAITFLIICRVITYGQITTTQEMSLKEEAERLWELGVAAKGGREKLHAVRNIVESSDGNIYEGIKLK